MSSILTGFPNLDSLIGGLQPADMLLLASPPLTENISLALSIVLNVTTISHHRVGMFTPTMNKHHIVQRLLALSADIDLHHIRTGAMTVGEHKHITQCARTLSHAKIWINDNVDLSILQLQQQAQVLVKDYDIAFLFIDTIHCLQSGHTNQQRKDRALEMVTMCDALKLLAKTLNIPVLVLAPYASLKANRYVSNKTFSYRYFTSRKKIADYALFLYRENVSQCAVQIKSGSMLPLLVVNHHNGFVTDIALFPQSGQPIFPDEAHPSLPTSHDTIAL